MNEITRRSFFLKLGLFVSFPFVSFSRKKEPSGKQDDLSASDIFQLMKKKIELINSIEYKVSINRISHDPQLDKNELSLPKECFEYYFDKKNLKIIWRFPTERTPSDFAGELITVWKGDKVTQKRISLDGSFKESLREKPLSSGEKQKLVYYLNDVVDMPKDQLVSSSGTEIVAGELTTRIIQNNCIFWISSAKRAVLKKEIYATENLPVQRIEYSNFVEAFPEIFLPSLVLCNFYTKNKKLISSFQKDIHDIKINVPIPESVFSVDAHKE